MIDLSNTLFPADVPFFVTNDWSDSETLFPAEKSYLEGKLEIRRKEFIRSRYCVKVGFERLNLPYKSVLPNQRRMPVWPDNVIGSISHSYDMAGAAVCLSKSYRSVGLDIEKLSARKSEDQIARYICTPDELDIIQEGDSDERVKKSRLVFCAKEAIFKCLYPLCQVFFGFKDASVDWSDDGTYRVRLNKSISTEFCKGFSVMGRWMIQKNCMMSGLILNHPG